MDRLREFLLNRAKVSAIEMTDSPTTVKVLFVGDMDVRSKVPTHRINALNNREITTTQSQTLPMWLDKLGDWNPQLLREIKERLSWRSVLLTVALVTIVQVLLMMNYIQQIPTEATIRFNSTYCTDNSRWATNQVRTWANCSVDWRRWWRDIFDGQNTSIAFFIHLPAVYLLISDINQEIQRGTLNFLRLSPRSSQTLLLGKLLGVPSLTYLALILVIPLHVLCGTMAGISPMFFLSYYSTFIVFGIALLMGAMLIGFSQRNTGNKSTSTAVSSSIFLGLLIAGAIVIPLFMAKSSIESNPLTRKITWGS